MGSVHDSRELSRVQICCSQPSHGSPLSTGESPNSLAHLTTLSCSGPCLHHSNPSTLCHAPTTLHSLRGLRGPATLFPPFLHVANPWSSFMSHPYLASSRKSSLTTMKLGLSAPHWPLTAPPCSAVYLTPCYFSLDCLLHWSKI